MVGRAIGGIFLEYRLRRRLKSFKDIRKAEGKKYKRNKKRKVFRVIERCEFLE